ncbi:MAG: HIT family protein [Candidatus Pacebacteria bacterium]|nr:HIT family protein [Candidatus Paceibacterota bacterium]
MACCDILKVFDEENNLIRDYKHWKLLLRNRNTTLGNCVAIIKRHIEKFSDITFEEMEDLANVVKDVEKALKASFSYDKINYLMLMMKDPHLHFHILPRYSGPRSFAGIEWTDDDWPKSSHKVKEEIPSDIMKRIKGEIVKNF